MFISQNYFLYIDAYRLIRNTQKKSILTNSQQSSPHKTVYIEHPLYQHQQQQSPKHQMSTSPTKCQTYLTMPARKLTESPNHHQLIQIQNPTIVGNAAIMTLDTSAIANNTFYPAVTSTSYVQCQLPPTPPPPIFGKNLK